MIRPRLLPLAMLLLAGAAAASEAASPAASDEGSDVESLLAEPVVSTASMAAESASTAPATSTSISADDLRRYGIRSLDEALNFLSMGVVVENTFSSSEIGARGVLLNRDYGNHVLLLIDGHAINEPWDGTAYFERGAAVPFELIDHIEVVLGPGSVLYGSNAMLGVVNVVTKRAKDYLGEHLVLESELFTSIRGAAGLGREFTLLGRPATLLAQVEYYDSRGPAFTYGPQNYGLDSVTGQPKQFGPDLPANGIWGGTSSRNLYAQVPAGFARFTLGDFELTARAALFKRSNPFSWTSFDDPRSYEQDRWLSLDARYHFSLTKRSQMTLRAYGDFYSYEERDAITAAEDCLEGQTSGCIYRLLGRSRWGGLEVHTVTDWLQDGRLVTVLGGDARLRWAGSDGAYHDDLSFTNGKQNTSLRRTERALALYAEVTGRPADWLGINAGARLDADQGFGSRISPRLATTLTPWAGTALKGIYSEAFRAPTAFELSYSDPLGELAAPDLKPERVRSVEVSIEQRFGTHRLLLGLFKSWWYDMVQLVSLDAGELAAAQVAGQLDAGASAATQYRNRASIANDGLNLAFDGTQLAGRLRYGLTATLARAEQDAGDGSGASELPAAARVSGNARLSYDPGGGLPVIGLAARWVGRRKVADTDFTPRPDASANTELRVTLSGPVPFVPGLTYRASADWATAAHGPYAIGPLRAPSPPDYVAQELIPIRRFVASVGLQYDLQ